MLHHRRTLYRLGEAYKILYHRHSLTEASTEMSSLQLAPSSITHKLYYFI